MFLMHRVELKDVSSDILGLSLPRVPNAPCGVESKNFDRVCYFFQMFLMHRVELKDVFGSLVKITHENLVPNAPCGVESVKSSRAPT